MLYFCNTTLKFVYYIGSKSFGRVDSGGPLQIECWPSKNKQTLLNISQQVTDIEKSKERIIIIIVDFSFVTFVVQGDLKVNGKKNFENKFAYFVPRQKWA